LEFDVAGTLAGELAGSLIADSDVEAEGVTEGDVVAGESAVVDSVPVVDESAASAVAGSGE
jgi:hypothetical protein